MPQSDSTTAEASLAITKVVTYTGHMRQINATEFKAKCLAILDEVSITGEQVTITKRGRPVAQLSPPVPSTKGYPQDSLKGSVVVHGDILEPAVPAELWEAEKGRLL